MAIKQKVKLSWLKTLSPIALVLGGFWMTELPAAAIPNIEISQNNLYLAQVGVRSRIVPPTPLNLSPRYHIPLPQSNYRHRDYGYDNYHDDYHHHHRYRRNGRRHSRNKGSVIIINPATEQHRSTSGSYIRIIRK